MESFTDGMASGPYELPEELHYLTPPPLCRFGRAGPAECAKPGSGYQTHSNLGIEAPLNSRSARSPGAPPPDSPAAGPGETAAGAGSEPLAAVGTERSATNRASGPYGLPDELHYLTPPPVRPAGRPERAPPVGGVPVCRAAGGEPRLRIVIEGSPAAETARSAGPPGPQAGRSGVEALTHSHPRPAAEAGQLPGKPKLLVQVRQAIRMRQYSPRTEQAYVQWIKRFIFFHKLRHPAEMGTDEVQDYLSHLAVRGQVSASTQNQALAALLFLYRQILGREIGFLADLVRAKRPRRLPVVLTPEEVEQVFAHLDGVVLLICQLLYGSGMRLLECLGIRVKDLGIQRNEITVRDGKGRKDRVTLLPVSCTPALNNHLETVRQLHENDLRNGLGRAPLPDALARKYPNAARQWGWQFVFPASSHYTDLRSGIRHRHHLHESVVQKQMAEAVRRAGLAKAATPHTLRHHADSRIMPSSGLWSSVFWSPGPQAALSLLSTPAA